MAIVREIGLDEVRDLTLKMKAFENASTFIKVSVDHSVKTPQCRPPI